MHLPPHTLNDSGTGSLLTALHRIRGTTGNSCVWAVTLPPPVTTVVAGAAGRVAERWSLFKLIRRVTRVFVGVSTPAGSRAAVPQPLFSNGSDAQARTNRSRVVTLQMHAGATETPGVHGNPVSFGVWPFETSPALPPPLLLPSFFPPLKCN